jgi:hypothetical protein
VNSHGPASKGQIGVRSDNSPWGKVSNPLPRIVRIFVQPPTPNMVHIHGWGVRGAAPIIKSNLSSIGNLVFQGGVEQKQDHDHVCAAAICPFVNLIPP